MNLKGTKTEQNLQTAFAGESQARNKYTFYASQAKKEGFEQIAALFTETANNEKEHAKMQRPVKTMSGPICMRPLPRKPEMKALTISQNCLRW